MAMSGQECGTFASIAPAPILSQLRYSLLNTGASMFRSLVLAILLFVGCSKPEVAKVEVPVGGSASIVPQSTETVIRDDALAMPMSRLEIVEALRARGFDLKFNPIAPAGGGRFMYSHDESGAIVTFFDYFGKTRRLFIVTEIDNPAEGKVPGSVSLISATCEILTKLPGKTSMELLSRAIQETQAAEKEGTALLQLYGIVAHDVIVQTKFVAGIGLRVSFMPDPQSHNWN